MDYKTPQRTEPGGVPQQPLPWHEDAWRRLAGLVERDSLPAAIILTGAEGLGKGMLAELFAQRLLCHQPKEGALPCGTCPGCRHYAAGSNPDFFRLAPAADKRTIAVDQIRAFSSRLFMTSHHDGARVGLVNPADGMTVNAANSLLKTLEEPPAGVHIILVAQRPRALPATIRSRCQIMPLSPPSREAGLAWLEKQAPAFEPALLEQAGRAPLKALALHENDHCANLKQWADAMEELLDEQASPVTVAAKWPDETFTKQLDWLTTWLMDAYKVKLGLPADKLANAGHHAILSKTARRLSWHRLRNLYAETMRACALGASQAVNRQLLLESLLISWSGKQTGE